MLTKCNDTIFAEQFLGLCVVLRVPCKIPVHGPHSHGGRQLWVLGTWPVVLPNHSACACLERTESAGTLQGMPGLNLWQPLSAPGHPLSSFKLDQMLPLGADIGCMVQIRVILLDLEYCQRMSNKLREEKQCYH